LAFFSLNWPPFNLDFVQEIVEKLSNWSIFGRLAYSLFFKTACNMGPQILSNYIASHISQGGLKFATQISPLLNCLTGMIKLPELGKTE
jgi:hypothetical protein